MKLLFMGTGPFAVPTFNAMVQSQHDVLGLVTRPDKLARGRKQAPPNPMREAAERLGVPVNAPDSINSEEGLALLEQYEADLFIVCDYGQILSNEALGKARLGGVNLHGSLLPKYRGAAPINWALLNGDSIAGITVIHMTPRLDGGPMLSRRSLEVGAEEDAVQLEAKLSHLGVEAVVDSLVLLSDWDGSTDIGQIQRQAEVTKAPRLKKSDGVVDWLATATTICNQVRALKPWPGTFTNFLRENKPPMRVILQQARVVQEPLTIDGQPLELAVGEGRSTTGETIVVQCGQGAIVIEQLQPAGKRIMDAAEFVRGYGTKLKFGPTT